VVNVPAAPARTVVVRAEHRVPPADPAEPARTPVVLEEALVGLGKPAVAVPDRMPVPDLGRPAVAVLDRTPVPDLGRPAAAVPDRQAEIIQETAAAQQTLAIAVAQPMPAIVAAPAQPDAISLRVAKPLP